MKEPAQQNRKDNDFWNVIYPICKAFPGESFIRDITLVRDSNVSSCIFHNEPIEIVNFNIKSSKL